MLDVGLVKASAFFLSLILYVTASQNATATSNSQGSLSTAPFSHTRPPTSTFVVKSRNCTITQPPASNSFFGQNATKSAFSYYIPYESPQACNIYGPTCQTGFITLNVSLGHCTATSTVLPCSSYLATQGQYLRAFDFDWTGPDVHAMPYEWQKRFGRQPECRSYSDALQHDGTLTMSGCPNGPSLLDVSGQRTAPAQIPPNYIPAQRQTNQTGFQCCGACAFHLPKVHVYYFPDPKAKAYCESRGRRIGFVGNPKESQILPGYVDRLNETYGAQPTTTVISGHTLYEVAFLKTQFC